MPIILDGTTGVTASAVTTTTWSPTNLVIPGNSTIGDASTDTLTVNATPAFSTDITLSNGSLVGDALKINLGNSVKGYFGGHAAGNGGFYINSQQANQDLRLRTQGTDRLVIASTGDVTISSTLTVSSIGGAQKRGLYVASGNGAGSPGGIYLLSATAAGFNAATYEAIGQRNDGNGASAFSGMVALGHLHTSGITSTGMSLGAVRFGGNSTGSTTADVRYSAQIVGLAESTWTNASSQPTALLFYTGSTGVDINSSIAECGTERMRIDSSGNVGIGTSSPAAKLNVVGSAVFSSFVDMVGIVGSGNSFISSSGGLFLNGYNNFQTGILTASSGTNLLFQTGSTERMRIDSSGNLLVGTTAIPSASTGNAAALAPTGYQIPLVLSRSVTTAAEQARFYNPNGNVGSIQTNGSATSYVTSSDYRLKEDIAPMTGALAKVSALKPVTYKWKIDGSDGQGFIAHELQEVVPNCVTGEKDAVNEDGTPKYQGIDTSFLVATLTAAIQEQQAIITSLTARIEALEA